MTTADFAMLWAGCGLCLGLSTADYLWRHKIQERAITGIRLLVRGRFYEVRDVGAVNGEVPRD